MGQTKAPHFLRRHGSTDSQHTYRVTQGGPSARRDLDSLQLRGYFQNKRARSTTPWVIIVYWTAVYGFGTKAIIVFNCCVHVHCVFNCCVHVHCVLNCHVWWRQAYYSGDQNSPVYSLAGSTHYLYLALDRGLNLVDFSVRWTAIHSHSLSSLPSHVFSMQK